MTTMIQWEPFAELRNTMDRLFDEGFSRPWRLLSPTEYQAAFPVDVWETSDTVEVKAALPGVRPEDVDISVTRDILTIKATCHESARQGEVRYHVRELSSGDSTRSITLPATVEAEQAEARFEDGMLYLKLPKSQALRPKQIKVTGANGGHMLSNN